MILVDRKVIEGIKLKAKFTYPNECCGLLSGKERNKLLEIEEFHSCDNFSNNPREEFQIDPLFHINLQKSLRFTDCKILGLYHSHPNGNLKPSKKDINYFNDYNFLWFIIALNEIRKSTVLIYEPNNGYRENFKLCQYYIKDEKF